MEGGKCMDGPPGPDDKDDKGKDTKDDGKKYGDGKYPWNDTQSPDYWENCVRRFCDKHVWYGGIRECHWEPKYGCGCEAMKKDECLGSNECEFIDDRKTGCREIIRCNELTGMQCKQQSKCALCDTGCVDKCVVGPGQVGLPVLSLSLTQNCECKLEAFF
jgi:hypothetical protein